MKIGIDEVGRGPLAGPLTMCAFTSTLSEKELLSLFPKGVLRDSKKLTEKQRGNIFTILEKYKNKGKVFYCIVNKAAKDIDTKGISLCIKESIEEMLVSLTKTLNVKEDRVHIFLDGSLKAPERFIHQETIIKGDEKVLEIACASIIAKVTRDTYMKEQSKNHPLYGFEAHVGYGTEKHRKSIALYGLTPLHRQSFCKNIEIVKGKS